MKSSKSLAALAVLGLTVAAATPALALENEFHGMFAARYINSNFNGTSTTSFGDGAKYGGDTLYMPEGKPKKVYSANFIEQRARLQYIAKANADLKLVTHFELDYTYWGNSSYGANSAPAGFSGAGRNGGGAIGADTVNFETKSIYLDANVAKNVNMRLGMQPYNDSFKGILFDADMAGIAFSSSYNKFTPSIGYFRFNDTGVQQDRVLGHLTNDLFLLDAKYAVSNELKVGAAYYLFRNNSDTTNSNLLNDISRQDVKMSTLGLNAEYTSGPLTLNGFGVLQAGTVNKRSTTAWALNAGAKYKVGPGTARTEFLYVSGESGTTGHSNAFYSVFNHIGLSEHGYYDNEMAILGRDKNAYTTDNSIIASAGNNAQGQIGGYIGYDLPVTSKLTTAFNAGFAAVAKENANKPTRNTGSKNKSNYLGTEINAEATYQLLEGLSVGTRVAYVVLGDYYKDVASNGTPVNPYDFKLMFKYTF
ncbi:hypothetical protein [Pelotalea chapellei]|uniref:Alginate export protein n=1 Tax=Pelotalea chapellei TaxID=44671 RepID=A0ABS5U4J3_9BACT|nr:hypothetical protein [Pelotalea chapellei]MBT1070567.1 hypothetical protein [Pelotalea chapellei]